MALRQYHALELKWSWNNLNKFKISLREHVTNKIHFTLEKYFIKNDTNNSYNIGSEEVFCQY